MIKIHFRIKNIATNIVNTANTAPNFIEVILNK